MIRGIYTSASGMIAESLRNDTIANNLANANTAGYKQDIAVTKDFNTMLIRRINDGEEQPVIGSLGTGVITDQNVTQYAAGKMLHTGNELDVALDGKGFFVVKTPQGLRYTRNGTFTRSAQGELVNSSGYPVMGQGGTVQLPDGRISIGEDGTIQVDDSQVDRLLLVDFTGYSNLVKQGDSLFAAPATAGNAIVTGRVRQGFIEQSNVNVVTEMINLIAGYRAYEVNAKAIQAHDQLLDKAVNEVGRV